MLDASSVRAARPFQLGLEVCSSSDYCLWGQTGSTGRSCSMTSRVHGQRYELGKHGAPQTARRAVNDSIKD
ncbi:hypothetical protein ElyMa_005424900 [Elysia marginata]|uniref:Uncharacterized protein n=1 Tax=Elysia marginata TaxID=1093978 RepID=A0AAV4EJZ2_9GAST|nr:hypothetical protein ElyMa_005424900 [Elysia marginata]